MIATLKIIPKNAFALALMIGAASVWSLSDATPHVPQGHSAQQYDNTGKETRPLHDMWGTLLSKYIQMDAEGLTRFNYAGLSASDADMLQLSAYIQGLSEQKPSTFARKEAMVYWANLYNAVTVQIVSENYPVSSILKIKSGLRPGPWKRKLVSVEGEKLSLDNIEHDIMRPTFKTPMVHYMVNCASIGCPNLKVTPWHVSTLDEELDIAARAYINSPRGVQIKNGKVRASKIYKWFKEDFGGNQAGVLAHLREYADDALLAELQGQTKIRGYEYDWSINE